MSLFSLCRLQMDIQTVTFLQCRQRPHSHASKTFQTTIFLNGISALKALPLHINTRSARPRARWRCWDARELTVAPRERARSAMAAMDRRNPNLDDFVGLNWSCWIDRVKMLSSDGESLSLSRTRSPIMSQCQCPVICFCCIQETAERGRPKQKTRWVLVQRVC